MPDRSSKHPKRPRDLNQLAASIVREATGQEDRRSGIALDSAKKNPAAVALGRLGGKKGGKARAAQMSAEERKELAQRAARARWSKEKKGT